MGNSDMKTAMEADIERISKLYESDDSPDAYSNLCSDLWEAGFEFAREGGGWVSVEERLPSKGLTQYFVTVDCPQGRYVKQTQFSYEPVNIRDTDQGFRPKWWNLLNGETVVAWREPLEPYKEAE